MRVVKLVGNPGPYLGEDRPQEGALVLRHNPAGGEPKLLFFNVDRNSYGFGLKGFSHPDALPLLIAHTFGNKQSSPLARFVSRTRCHIYPLGIFSDGCLLC
ncbi:hypothetical protein K443DRAFT_311397 [Laccaria amethystina LaAM-08-1]|uniref:Uncharacterized protein n=1 Tax=Laccaria amethystina LaAM-08-1 TaxID=1095629 RepID=A0A0C9XEB4_9AGAR|nr:hypothetical protein K443DRAFT_311397 [Laccaria amethystina LaAM-08-1]